MKEREADKQKYLERECSRDYSQIKLVKCFPFLYMARTKN